jgi:tripeptide aminopeptidase
VPSEALDLFLELAAVASPSGAERAVADLVLGYVSDLGLPADEDDTGPAIGSSMGNIVVALEPTAEGEPLFLCAHLDTVPPVDAVDPVVEDGVVRNRNAAILGGDNKAAVAVMLDAVRRVLAESRPHAGIELLFTAKEETGLEGAYAFDASRLRATVGYVYDQAETPRGIILGQPSASLIEVAFHGRAAHAGMFPEEGRSAIVAAARAISEMKLGRIDEETTANIGVIEGGSAANVVPDTCTLVGEARSHDDRKLADQVQAMQDALTLAAGVADAVETKLTRHYTSYRFAKGDPPYASPPTRSGAAASSRGTASPEVPPTRTSHQRGLQCVNLANGMTDIHTPDEHRGRRHRRDGRRHARLVDARQ